MSCQWRQVLGATARFKTHRSFRKMSRLLLVVFVPQCWFLTSACWRAGIWSSFDRRTRSLSCTWSMVTITVFVYPTNKLNDCEIVPDEWIASMDEKREWHHITYRIVGSLRKGHVSNEGDGTLNWNWVLFAIKLAFIVFVMDNWKEDFQIQVDAPGRTLDERWKPNSLDGLAGCIIRDIK